MEAKLKEKIENLFSVEVSELGQLEDSADKWKKLERLHIIGQLLLPQHFKVHFMMLNLAFKERNGFEIIGQIMRIALVIPGHLFGRLPIGNVGTSRVSAFAPMQVPTDINEILAIRKKN